MKTNKKELLTTSTCAISFVLGWGLTVAGFIVPPVGEVSSSVLWILGQTLLYCGACVGISQYYSAKVKDFENEIISKISK